MNVLNVKFDEKKHEYRDLATNAVVPSVTQIMDTVIPDPFCINERAARFGSALHTVVSLDILDMLHDYEYDPALDPWLEGARRYRRGMWDHTPVLIDGMPVVELAMHSEAYGYAGTPDMLTRGSTKPPLYLIDWKSWSQVSGKLLHKAFVQLAAYEMILRDIMDLRKGERVQRCVVWLKQNDYCPYCDGKSYLVRFNEFRSVWNVYNSFYGGTHE